MCNDDSQSSSVPKLSVFNGDGSRSVDRLRNILGADVVLLRCVGKRPKDKGWQSFTAERMTQSDPACWRGNIGALLGRNSGDLCAIDIDCDEAVAPFFERNPRLLRSARIRGARGCKVFVRIVGNYPGKFTIGDEDDSFRNSIEWLANGQQAIVHGHHPDTKEPYVWECESAPVEVRFETILFKPSGTLRSQKTATTAGTASHCTDYAPLNALHPLHNIRRRKAIMAELNAIDVRLGGIFENNVEQYYPARRGQRHGTMITAVEFLYRFASSRTVRLLLDYWYRINANVFQTSHGDHLSEVDAAIAGTAARYLASLPADEREIYLALSEQQKDAFRIARDLAQRRGGRFYLASGDLARRIGIPDMAAWRVLQWLVNTGVLLPLSRGSKRAPGQSGKAAEFEWFQRLDAFRADQQQQARATSANVLTAA